MSLARLRSPVSVHDHAEGPAGAPVTLVEYGDYECTHCGRAYPVVERLRGIMRDRMRFVFRNFPLAQQHPRSQAAASAAEAAGLQGRFWEMHRILFANQRDLDRASLYEYAAELRLDIDRFELDLRGKAIGRRIDADIESGLRSGVNRTPTFFLNGLRYDGDWAGYGFLEAVHDAALARAEA